MMVGSTVQHPAGRGLDADHLDPGNVRGCPTGRASGWASTAPGGGSSPQIIAEVFVFGSYFLAERMRSRGEGPARSPHPVASSTPRPTGRTTAARDGAPLQRLRTHRSGHGRWLLPLIAWKIRSRTVRSGGEPPGRPPPRRRALSLFAGDAQRPAGDPRRTITSRQTWRPKAPPAPGPALARLRATRSGDTLATWWTSSAIASSSAVAMMPPCA